jgi:hypothetical protein
MSFNGDIFDLNNFTINYLIEEPLCLIFRKDSLEKYQIIFNFLWKIKRAIYTLNNLWLTMHKSG